MMGEQKQEPGSPRRGIRPAPASAPGREESISGGAERAQETRIAVIGIIVEDKEAAESVNAILHQYSRYIIGRMGLPYEKKKVSIISIVVDAPQDSISAISGKLGRLHGVSSKALYSKAAAE